jgi:phage baseplate assembly protein W
MSGLTPKLPLIRSDEDGTYKLIKSYKNLIKQNFRNLILTAPGERMMDPNFGVGIRNYLFENDGEALYSAIRAKIHEQVTRYIPFVSITYIDFSPYDSLVDALDRNLLKVDLGYTILPLSQVDKLEITLPHN